MVGINRLPGQNRVAGRTQVLACDGNAIAGAAVVELPPVDQFLVPVEEEEIRGAGCPVGLRDLLTFVVAVGERVTQAFRFPGHVRRRILGVVGNIVGADRDNRDALLPVVLPESRQALGHMLHIGAVVAEKHHQQCRRTL